MMRVIAVSTLLLSALCALAADDSAVVFVGHEQVAKGGALVTAPNLAVMLLHRDSPGMAEIHDRETDTFYVLDGAATLVTGGTMVGGSVTAPGQQRGTGISRGQTRQLVKGDVVVIPAGVPHWFQAVPASIDYYVVKVIEP